jgi:transcriptional regulator with GAF, ATPase, and Fis domain
MPLETLAQLCLAGLEVLPVEAIAVTVMNRSGHGGVVHASNALAGRLEDSAFTLGEGPAVDAFLTGAPVFVADLDSEFGQRWPAFTQEALTSGCRSMLALPLCIGRITVGTLTFYAMHTVTLSEAELALANSMIAPAARALIDHVDDSMLRPGSENGLNGADRPATFIRAEVYQASGMVMAQISASIDQAMATLRAYAFSHNQPINDVAHEVVGRRLRFDSET